MNFEFQKFFIGLMDFFSILLPGALLTWLLMGAVGPAVLGDRCEKIDGAQAWAAFLLASYLFGHLVFLLGAQLDDFCDWTWRYALNKRVGADQGGLGRCVLAADNAVVTTRFFLMEAVGRGWREEKDREHLWHPMPQACRACQPA